MNRLLSSLFQFARGVFQLRQAPDHLSAGPGEPRVRAVTTFVCPTCRREFRALAALRGHRCLEVIRHAV